tara:strand:+ start:1998 stop:2426 length:429 start_codon:yes stop_codon:yes gene_type:complete
MSKNTNFKVAENKESQEAREKFINQLVKVWGRLQLSEVPPTSTVTDMVDMCTTTRGNRFRFLKSPRKGGGKEDSVLFERLRWHRVIPGSTGWLGSAIGSTWKVDEETFDRLDTFAMLIGLCQGRVSWTEEWAKALKLHATSR